MNPFEEPPGPRENDGWRQNIGVGKYSIDHVFQFDIENDELRETVREWARQAYNQNIYAKTMMDAAYKKLGRPFRVVLASNIAGSGGIRSIAAYIMGRGTILIDPAYIRYELNGTPMPQVLQDGFYDNDPTKTMFHEVMHEFNINHDKTTDKYEHCYYRYYSDTEMCNRTIPR